MEPFRRVMTRIPADGRRLTGYPANISLSAESNIVEPFRRFMTRMPADGRLPACPATGGILRVFSRCWQLKPRAGGSTWRSLDPQLGSTLLGWGDQGRRPPAPCSNCNTATAFGPVAAIIRAILASTDWFCADSNWWCRHFPHVQPRQAQRAWGV